MDGREARVARTRERVLRAAAELVQEGGPAAITYSALAERSGVGRATLYRHWPEMSDLWSELRAEMVGAFEAQLTGDPQTDLARVLTQMIAFLRGGAGGPSLITLLERSQWDPETRGHVAAAERGNPLRMALAAAQRSGRLQPDADMDALCALILGPLLYRAFLTDRPLDLDYAMAVADAVLTAWGPGGSTGALRLP